MPQLAGDFGAFEYIAHSAGSVVALNLGKPVEPRKMRRGDVVGIDWQSGNGHATFCWNVHLNKNGEVDCFQFISSNGTAAGGAGITLFRYPDVDPKYMERSGSKYLKKKEMFAGIIDDPKAYPEYIEKPYWWFGLPGFKKGDIDLDTFGVPAKNVQISYAGSMPVSLAVCHVSRLGGVVPPEPYLRADGGKTPEPAADEAPKPIKAKAKKSEEAKEPEKAPPPAESHPAHDEAEDNLGVLWKARWISTDPADPKAAMRDFQSKYMGGNVPQPGHPDPKTREKIARYAAWATNQAQVHAGLSIAFHRGELKVAPGDNPAQLDDATIAAVKAFQKQKGLGVDGIPGHDTQAALASYMKEAAQSQSAPEPDQPAAKSDDKPAAKPQIKSLYFVRNNGPAGKKATLKATTEGCDGKSCSVSLVKDGKTLVADAGKISFDSGVGILELSIPEGLTLGAKVFAQLGGELSAETKSPFLVLDTVDLPPILAGPIVRGAEPGQVWFWLATSVQVDGVTAKISQMEGGGGFGVPVESAYKSVRLGERLWVTLVSAKPNSGTFPLDKILDYDIALTYDTGTSSKEVKISEEEGLGYAPYKRPTFVIASKNSRVAHGSCRRPGASGTDAYPSLDRWLTSAASDPAKRVAALFLTGDQIYADDVARSLFQSVRSLSKHLMGFDETLQLDGSHTSTSAANMVFTDPDDKKKPPPGSRRNIILRHGFTTEDAQGHLITFGEFAAMYLLVCNPKLCE